MRSVLRSLETLSFLSPARHPDLLFALGVVSIIATMLLPLPPALIDVLLAADLAFAALVLGAALLAHRPLAVSTFPTLLLVTTLFRLALNVSTTRLILAKGDAGEVVQAFGHFVVGGDLAVGLVVFVVVMLVQFLVIAKGAERVAEVAARFALDAMPGKQLSIDAAVRAGGITEDEAEALRDDLSREAQFHGAMDGAMKFVRGDAIAGLAITAVNLVAGFAVGVLRDGVSPPEAARVYAILTVGDGLVSQVPALVVALSAGILVTRVSTRKERRSLGASLAGELLSSPRVVGVGAGFAGMLAFVPGFPAFPFALIGVALSVLAVKRAGALRRTREEKAESFEQTLAERLRRARAQRALADRVAPAVAPITIDLGGALAEALGLGAGGDDATELFLEHLPGARHALYLDTGVPFPAAQVRYPAPGLSARECVVRIKDVPIARAEIPEGAVLAEEAPERLARLGVTARPAEHPATAAAASLVPADSAEVLAAAGVPCSGPARMVAMLLYGVMRRHAAQFLGLSETAELVDRLEKAYPALVKEVVPKLVSLAQLTDVLRRLIDEGVSVRDLKTVLEALSELGPHETDGVALTEHVRAALQLQIAHAYAGWDDRLRVLMLDALIEDTVRTAIVHTDRGSYLALEPELRRAILDALKKAVLPVARAGVRPVLLTHAEVRRYVRKLVEEELPEVGVLSFSELPARLTIQPLGRVSLEEEAFPRAA